MITSDPKLVAEFQQSWVDNKDQLCSRVIVFEDDLLSVNVGVAPDGLDL